MPLEVLLIADVPKLGQIGDVVTVSDGYARNYLLPKKFATLVTPSALKKLEKLRVEREMTRKLELESARELASKLSQVSCTITSKTTEGGKLYGSVTASDILENLKAQGIVLDKKCIELEQPIKEIGVYNVKVKLHSQVEANIKVWVVEGNS